MARTANTRSLGKGDPTARPYSQAPSTMAAEPGQSGSGGGSAMIAPIAGGGIENQSSTTYRFIVSFFSVASGPDRESMASFEKWTEGYASERKLSISAEKISWGREGEMDYCYLLDGLNEEQKNAFVSAAKEQLKSAKQVNIFENEPCRHQKKN